MMMEHLLARVPRFLDVHERGIPVVEAILEDFQRDHFRRSESRHILRLLCAVEALRCTKGGGWAALLAIRTRGWHMRFFF